MEQRLTVLVPRLLGKDVDHLRSLPQGAVRLAVEGALLRFGKRGDGLGQLRAHHRTDGEADAPTRFLLPLRGTQQSSKLLL